VTEQTETINGKTDFWAKIIDSKGRIGWVFCGDATIERGGPRYLTPENEIEMYFSVP
jgi:hypothetical protein